MVVENVSWDSPVEKCWAVMVCGNGVTDNCRGNPVTLIAGCWLFHAVQSAKPELN